MSDQSSSTVTESSKSCTICDHNYDTQEKRPQVLPCGHTFCFSCLKQIELSERKFCPLCRKPWACVENLPTCYQLLPQSPSLPNPVKKRKYGHDFYESICEKHNFKFIYYCSTCKKRACKVCLLIMHKFCTTVLLEESAASSAELKHLFEDTKQKLETHISDYAASIAQGSKSLTAIKTFRETISGYINDLSAYQTVIEGTHKELQSYLSLLEEDRNHSDNEIRNVVDKANDTYEPLEMPNLDIWNAFLAMQVCIYLIKYKFI